MRIKIVSPATLYLLSVLFLCGCSGNAGDPAADGKELKNVSAATAFQPEISQVKELCELATLECYYHNVAKSVKEKGSGLLHIGEKERVFWIEYSGSAKFGIDMSQVAMEIEGEQVFITIPDARLLGLSDYSFTEDSYVSSDDGLNKNPITAENQTEAIAAANEQMEELFSNNKTMLMRAQTQAKKLIENYISQISELSGVEYQLNWIYEDNLPAGSAAAE